jgi:hypothetical protein
MSDTNLTRDQIEAMRTEAGTACDYSMVETCDRAIEGDADAIAAVRKAIDDAAAMGDEKPIDRTHRLYCEARSRVEADELLAQYAETILADYPEGDEHWQWVIDAPIDEIVAWAKAAAR